MDIAQSPLFEGIPAEHLAWAMRYFRAIEVDYGTRLMEEGDTDPSLLIVLDGKLEISTGGVVLGTASPGEIVGEVAVFGAGVRIATVESLTSTRLLLLDRPGYVILRNADSPVAHAIEEFALGLLTRRLRATSRRIGDLAEGGELAKVAPAPGFFSRVAALFGLGGAGAAPRDLDRRAALAGSDLFADAPDFVLDELAALFEASSCSAGHFLCTEGEIGAQMFLIASGEVDVVVGTQEERVETLASLGAGDAFGMCSLVEEMPRMASCIARGPVVTLTLGRAAWHQHVTSGGVLGSVLRTAMIRALSEQVSFANAQLSQLDVSRQMRIATGTFGPLQRAAAGMEAYGRHLSEE